MSDPILLYFNLGAQEMLILFGCCGFPVIAGIGAIVAFFVLRQSKSKKEE